MTTIVPGRFQPLHVGHKELINKLLSDDKKVLVLIRDTKISEKNPYTYQQRYMMFYNSYRYEMRSGKLKVQKIDDFDEIAYGRKVGYKITKILHDKGHISATNIRKELREKTGKR